MSCAVIIPVYRSCMTPFEKVSLLRLRQLIHDDVYLIAPNGLCLDEYLRLWPDLRCERFDPRYFASIASYNKLMLSPDLYLRFAAGYEWVLIHQLDAFLFHADLSRFCNSSYDYFGAPWIPGQLVHPVFSNPRLLKLFGTRVTVGNGGLSLRRILPTVDLLTSKRDGADRWSHNEDGFYAYWGIRSKSFRSCPLEVAALFAFERDPEMLYRLNGQVLPLGCHGLPKYTQEFYTSIINPLLPDIEGVDSELACIFDPEL
ncbi:MAG: DUF5672 family protein [Cellvibrio sp.]|uniref:DUF5672 family protein n=1 Tax=Cellvibrio sp. TaxID=1965322 RepID=UPI0027196202|nr:DUF5672 family protein [Cellvibrio sp.]